MGLARTVNPAEEPLTLAEGKAHLRVLHSAEDSLIGTYLSAAVSAVEEHLRRALVTQTWRLTLDRFPCGSAPIRLPRPPLLSVSAVEYVDGDGAAQTLAADLYQVRTDPLPGEVRLAYGATWPATRDEAGAVRITYVAGYGAAAAVPAPIRAAILLLLGDLYTGRTANIVGTIVAANPTVAALLGPHVYREAV